MRCCLTRTGTHSGSWAVSRGGPSAIAPSPAPVHRRGGSRRHQSTTPGSPSPAPARKSCGPRESPGSSCPAAASAPAGSACPNGYRERALPMFSMRMCSAICEVTGFSRHPSLALVVRPQARRTDAKETISLRLQPDMAAMPSRSAAPFGARDETGARVSSWTPVRYDTYDCSAPVAKVRNPFGPGSGLALAAVSSCSGKVAQSVTVPVSGRVLRSMTR